MALFSLEMASVQLITRMIASETGISSEELRKGQMSEEDGKDYSQTLPLLKTLRFI